VKMLLSSKVLKGVDVTTGKPREIRLRGGFEKMSWDEELDPAIGKELNTAKAEANGLIINAQNKAKKITAQAKKEGEILKVQAMEEGKKSGYQTGYQEGFLAGQAEVDKVIKQKEAVILDLKAAQQKMFTDNEQAMVELALAIAEKVIHKQVDLDPSVTVEIAKSVLREAHAGESYLLFVHPSKLESMVQYKSQLAPQMPMGATLQIMADPEIAGGGCRLETNLGFSDGTIESQLNEVKKALQLP
jgi:flagellar assembly protein FliH